MEPVLIGAGIGALGAGGAGLMGAGGAAGATSAATEGVLSSAAPVLGDAALISPFTPTGVAGIQTANASLSGLSPILGQAGEQAIAQGANMYTGSQGMFDVAKGSTLGYNPSFLGGQGPATFAGGGGYDPSFLGRINESIGNIGNPFSDLTARDKLGLGLQGVGMLNQPQQQMQTPPVMPITRGNPDMVSSPLYNVAPNVGKQQGNEIGLPNLLSRMPLTEEEKAQLARLNQRY